MNGLDERGQDIYDALVEGRGEIAAPLKAMAINAARMADTLDRIEFEMALNPQLTVENSQGTRTVNPLISEARMLTGALSQILAKLGVSSLPAVEQQEKTRVDQLAERRAERARQRDAARQSNTKDSAQPGG